MLAFQAFGSISTVLRDHNLYMFLDFEGFGI